MTRFSLCCWGNSHLAALKIAWDKHRSEYPGITLGFFGAPGKQLREIEIKNGKATPQNPQLARALRLVSGGAESVDLEAHDAFALVGLELGFRVFLTTLRGHLATPEFKTARKQQDLISDTCLRHCLKDLLTHSVSVKLLKKLKRDTPKPVYIITEPHLSEAALNQKATDHLPRLKRTGALPRMHGLYSEFLERIVLEAGGILVPQPSDTLTDDGFTRKKFSRGSSRLLAADEQHDGDDARHMNEAYGNRVLKDLFTRIEADLPLQGRPGG